MKLHPFVKAVAAMQFDNSFNPYVDRCPIHDRRSAPRYRATTLSAMLERATASPVEAIWVGRDLGYRGGRRTGMALTDDVHIERHARRWGIVAERPTLGTAVAERTAGIIWDVLDTLEANIFLWNVFPLHPHESGDPFSNRQHNAAERRAGEALLAALVTLLRPRRIVAIGNDAQESAQRIAMDVPVCGVRHPSYGGQRDFVAGVRSLYDQRATALI
jgi:hypothetical protein